MDSLIKLQSLVDEAKCFDTVRRLRWPEGVRCPVCESDKVARGLGQFPRRRGGGWVRQIALTSFLPGAVVIDFPDDLCAAA